MGALNLNLTIPDSIAKDIDETIEEYSKEIIQKGFNASNLPNILKLPSTSWLIIPILCKVPKNVLFAIAAFCIN